MTTGVSIKPSNASKGGILDDVDVTLTSVRFISGEDAAAEDENMANYPDVDERLFLKVVMQDEEADYRVQYYSSGAMEYFQPADDGIRAVPVGERTALSESSNAVTFIASIVNAFPKGFSEDDLSDDVSVFDGIKCHVIQVAQKKRAGLEGSKDKTLLVVEKILSMPGEAKKGSPEKTAETTDLAAETTDVIEEILIAADGEKIKKASLFKQMLSKLAKDKAKQKKIHLASEDDFLAADDAPWEYDGKQLWIERE